MNSLYQNELIMSEYEPMPEYRLIYHWDAEHWTCITTGDIPVDICQYVKKHLEEMRDAMEVSEDAYFSIEYYYGKRLVHKWEGTPDGIFETITEVTNDWLSLAFQ